MSRAHKWFENQRSDICNKMKVIFEIHLYYVII